MARGMPGNTRRVTRPVAPRESVVAMGNRTTMPTLDAVIGRLEQIDALDGVARKVSGVVSDVTHRTGVVSLLSGTWIGHPLHPILTDLPIGSWTSAFVLDLVGGKRARPAAQMLVGLGVLAAVPTAVTGLSDWADTVGSTRRVGSFHALSNVRGSSATATFASSFHVAFDVTRPVDYTLLYGFGASGAGNDVTPTAVFITPSGTRDIHLGVDETGVLQPGAYQFQVDDVGGKNVTYTLSFEAVPLPPALWATLAALPVVAVAVVWMRRASKC